jgi:hypothetical protein
MAILDPSCKADSQAPPIRGFQEGISMGWLVCGLYSSRVGFQGGPDESKPNIPFSILITTSVLSFPFFGMFSPTVTVRAVFLVKQTKADQAVLCDALTTTKSRDRGASGPIEARHVQSGLKVDAGKMAD